MLAIAAFVPFLDNVNRLFQKRFCFSQVSAGRSIMVSYLVPVIFSTPLGLLVDKVGFKRYFILAGMMVYSIGHLIILAYPQCDGDSA